MNKRGFGIIILIVAVAIALGIGIFMGPKVIGQSPPGGFSSAFVNAHECTRDEVCEVNALISENRIIAESELCLGGDCIGSWPTDVLEVAAIVEEGQQVNLNLKGQNYEVSILFISSTETILNVNDEETNFLGEGERQRLQDYLVVEIVDINKSGMPGEIGHVEFILGDFN